VAKPVIVIAGSSGLIGSALAAALRAAEHPVLRIVRRTPANSDELHRNPESGEFGWPQRRLKHSLVAIDRRRSSRAQGAEVEPRLNSGPSPITRSPDHSITKVEELSAGARGSAVVGDPSDESIWSNDVDHSRRGQYQQQCPVPLPVSNHIPGLA
jgi:nucleoside-diphosphate-sugar epimerase